MWNNIKSKDQLDELKQASIKIGGFKGIKTLIKKDLNIEKNAFKSWSGLMDFIIFFNTKFERKSNLSINEEDSYFKSDAHKYIFALCELDGEKRADMLGITREHYSSLKLAKEWKRYISKKIHPDICHHKDAAKAIAKANSIYEGMIKYGE